MMEKTIDEKFPYGKDNKERLPWEHYLSQYEQADPEEIAQRLQIAYDSEHKRFTLEFLGTVYHVTWPDFQVDHKADDMGYYPLEDMIAAKILMIRYLLKGKSSFAVGNFCTYSEMPWGNVYQKQFHGRCILRLAYGFGNKLEHFQKVMEKMGGKKMEFGDLSYEICLVGQYYIRYILWEGDEEFPPSSQILFSDNFPQAFEAEDMAVTGDVTISMMKALERMINS